MTSNGRQSQFELFPRNPQNQQEPRKSAALLKDLTLSQENIIVSCIVLLMVCILSFSFGVERGKRNTGIAQLPQTQEDSTDGIIVLTDKIDDPEDIAAQDVEVIEEEVIQVKEQILEVPIEEEIIPEDVYTIQVASFKRKENALKEAEGLKKEDYKSFVVPKGSYSIVCVGKFVEKNRAKVFSKKLIKKYKDCLVRRL